MSYERILVQENIQYLQQGVDLMNKLSDEMYRYNDYSSFGSGVGKHMRHIVDHYLSFLKGLDGKIDYDARERDTRLEEDRLYAIGKTRGVINDLKELLSRPEKVNQAALVNSNEGEHREGEMPWSQSSLKRELQFLLSHTVHHYALVALILRIQNFQTPKEFGVAPSTLKYQKSLERETSGQEQ